MFVMQSGRNVLLMLSCANTCKCKLKKSTNNTSENDLEHIHSVLQLPKAASVNAFTCPEY